LASTSTQLSAGSEVILLHERWLTRIEKKVDRLTWLVAVVCFISGGTYVARTDTAKTVRSNPSAVHPDRGRPAPVRPVISRISRGFSQRAIRPGQENKVQAARRMDSQGPGGNLCFSDIGEVRKGVDHNLFAEDRAMLRSNPSAAAGADGQRCQLDTGGGPRLALTWSRPQS